MDMRVYDVKSVLTWALKQYLKHGTVGLFFQIGLTADDIGGNTDLDTVWYVDNYCARSVPKGWDAVCVNGCADSPEDENRITAIRRKLTGFFAQSVMRYDDTGERKVLEGKSAKDMKCILAASDGSGEKVGIRLDHFKTIPRGAGVFGLEKSPERGALVVRDLQSFVPIAVFMPVKITSD